MKAGGGGRLLPPAALREPRRPARSSRRHDRPPCRPATRREPIDGLMSSDGPSFRRPPCPCQRFRHSFGNIPYAGTRLGASIAAVQIILHASRRRGRKEMGEGHPPSMRVSFETFECRRTDLRVGRSATTTPAAFSAEAPTCRAPRDRPVGAAAASFAPPQLPVPPASGACRRHRGARGAASGTPWERRASRADAPPHRTAGQLRPLLSASSILELVGLVPSIR